MCFDKARELVFANQHFLSRNACLKLNVRQGLAVGRVGYRDEQSIATLEERYRVVFSNEFIADNTLRERTSVEGIEVQNRCSELLGCRVRDFFSRDTLFLNQVSHPGQVGLPGFLMGFDRGRLFNNAS
jgi:hypothetical protein